MRWILKDEVKEVYAEISNGIGHKEFDDVGFLSLTFQSGVFGTLDASWSRPKSFPTWGDVTLEVVTERGTLSLDMFAQNLVLYSDKTQSVNWCNWGGNMDDGLVGAFAHAIAQRRTRSDYGRGRPARRWKSPSPPTAPPNKPRPLRCRLPDTHSPIAMNQSRLTPTADEPARAVALSQLSTGWPRLSAAMGQVMAESASACLEDRGHALQVKMRVIGLHMAVYTVHRLPVTDQLRSTRNDLQDAIEWGACGIAILVISDVTDYTIVEKAWKGGGFDYWLGDKNDPLFQKRARLEVSGILSGQASTIEQRMKVKLKQSGPSDFTNTPAYAVVVEFSAPTTRIEIK